MRFSSRPVSSPGRTTENPPPPLLMRFLRSKSRSRSRSRGQRRRRPIFFRRKNNAAVETQQEPSSPKVTCMGQVRIINRSKKPKPVTSRRRRRRCGFFCYSFTGKLKPTCFNPVWRKWKSFSQVSFSRKSEKRSSSSRSEPIFGRSSTVEPEKIQIEEDKSFEVTPPRNALLLTRCRSAPYNRSPPSLEEEHKAETKRCVLGSPPRVLTRCNSEPSRIGEKLVLDNNPRLGFT